MFLGTCVLKDDTAKCFHELQNIHNKWVFTGNNLINQGMRTESTMEISGPEFR